MNRDDLLKRCVDRRVAHETSVVAVSHLFYVYLLSALKKGQRVEVPGFGTFGTHMVGVKRQRRMPFFEVENELADKVNERYRNLKTLLVGKYELVPAEGEIEYGGKEPKDDTLIDRVGKELVLDTDRDIAAEEFRRETIPPVVRETIEPETVPPQPVYEEPVRQEPSPQEPTETEPALPPKERKLMPKEGFNLRGEGMDDAQPAGPESQQPPTPPPTLRDISGGEGPSPLLQILLGLVILGAITFALNHFGIIHLWGKKQPAPQQVEEMLPPSVQPPQKQGSAVQGEQPAQKESLAQKPEETPTPSGKEVAPTLPTKKERKEPSATEKKKETQPVQAEPQSTPPSGTGKFTVQVSSWLSRADADRVVSRLSKSRFDAYVAEAFVKDKKWFRVRVGHYATSAEAQAAATNLKSLNENGVWVTKVE